MVTDGGRPEHLHPLSELLDAVRGIPDAASSPSEALAALARCMELLRSAELPSGADTRLMANLANATLAIADGLRSAGWPVPEFAITATKRQPSALAMSRLDMLVRDKIAGVPTMDAYRRLGMVECMTDEQATNLHLTEAELEDKLDADGRRAEAIRMQMIRLRSRWAGTMEVRDGRLYPSEVSLMLQALNPNL